MTAVGVGGGGGGGGAEGGQNSSVSSVLGALSGVMQSCRFNPPRSLQ